MSIIKSVRLFSICIFIITITTTASAVTSLYVLPHQESRWINAYEVDGYSLTDQDSNLMGMNDWGAVGLTLDPQLNILSQTAEGYGEVALFNAIDLV